MLYKFVPRKNSTKTKKMFQIFPMALSKYNKLFNKISNSIVAK